MKTPTTHRCTQEACPFSETGECLENIPLDECSHLVDLVGNAAVAEEDGIEPETPGLNVESDMVQIYTAKAFEPSEVDELAAQKECTLVVIAGDVDSGKTTLVGRCYAQFLLGSVSGWLYAGSRTLLGFDERIHHHRMGSMRPKPITLHTPKGIERYYHLDLCTEDGSQKRTLLIHDISGEDYQDAMAKSSVAATFTMIKRADAVGLLLDGRQLVRRGVRQRPASRLSEIVRALAEQKLLQHAPLINLIVTCWDHVLHENKVDEVNSYLNTIERQIKSLLEDYQVKSPLNLHRIASITHYKETPAGFGFNEVFESWIAARPKPRPIIEETLSKQGSREGWTEIGRNQEAQDG